MPEKLWNQTIQLAHKDHHGTAGAKSRLREKVWWPDLDKQLEKLVRGCRPRPSQCLKAPKIVLS